MSQENPNVNPVDINLQGMGLDDAALNISEEQPEGASLESVLDAQQQQPEQQPQGEQPPKGEKQADKQQAGWIQKRIQEGVQKQLQTALDQERARIVAEYDAKLRPLQDSIMSREADELVSSGEFKTKERALEYLRLKAGQPAPLTPAQPARNEKGQFTQPNQPNQPAPDTEQYGQMLIAQVKALEASGIDVMEAYNTDPEIKRKVLSREWDFSDVARHLTGAQAPNNPLPSPTRRPNGGGPAARSIHDLSDDQFEKIQRHLERGGTIDMRQR